MTFEIKRFSSAEVLENLDAFSEILIDAVKSGASVGFLSPLSRELADRWWREQRHAIDANEAVLLVAVGQGVPVGTVQLRLALQPNASHRAEVAKLLVHTRVRRHGIGRKLMLAVEEQARTLGRTLLLLDTQAGSPAEFLYRSLGYQDAGIIPDYAALPNGVLADTNFMWKRMAR